MDIISRIVHVSWAGPGNAVLFVGVGELICLSQWPWGITEKRIICIACRKDGATGLRVGWDTRFESIHNKRERT